jgi:hypothetical protein
VIIAEIDSQQDELESQQAGTGALRIVVLVLLDDGCRVFS